MIFAKKKNKEEVGANRATKYKKGRENVLAHAHPLRGSTEIEY